MGRKMAVFLILQFWSKKYKMDNKTIYALSTLFGKSGIAVIRISGLEAFAVFSKMTELSIAEIISRKMYYTKLKDPVSRETLDNCLIVGFRKPNSFTGEDTVEINCHGSKAVIRSIINSLSKLENFRLAEPGEFSRRSFYNGKMDLTAADGLADLIDAETTLQQKTALRQMRGVLFDLYNGWRERLLSVLSYLEAYIDFPDENIPEDSVFKIENNVFKLAEEIKKYLADNKVDERLREGFHVVIAGPTNAGKSSLINALVRRNVAIVSDIAGTTRDVIESYIDLNGYPVILSDTAGLRESSDEIERAGIALAEEKIREADFRIFMFDAANDTPDVFSKYRNYKEKNELIVANKCDKLSADKQEKLQKQGCVLVSVKNNFNLSIIVDKICAYLNGLYLPSSSQLITRQRYKEALLSCVNNLDSFSMNKNIELAAEDIRLACRELGKITGRVEVNEILDKIFSSFCIGK